MVARRLSKSRLMAGAQCAKRLWLELNQPELREIDAQTQRLFDTGHAVGAAAQTLWPAGVLIGHDDELSAALEETRQRLAEPGALTLFEATFRAAGVLIRADILERREGGDIRLVEVKASTSLKPYHVTDCAIQYWVLDQVGLAPAVVELAHIDNQFIYGGDGNYEGLFAFEDVTGKVRKLQPQIGRLITEMQAIADAEMPDIEVGPQCTNPYACPFIGFCLPQTTEYPIASLPGSSQVKRELLREGYEDIRDIPAGRLTNAQQEWVRSVTVAGEADLDPAAAVAIGNLGWPRYYLDFETVSFAVPVWRGTGPYKPYPFQWSCHIEYESGDVEHREFLAPPDGPPMRACMEALIEALDEDGPVIVYTDYEKRILTAMAELFPDLAAPLRAIVVRLFDLHPVTREHYYHPDMQGSWSIKKVLPTIAPDLAYEDLELISDGSAAEAAFADMVTGALPAEQHANLRSALLEYCRRDTEAMRVLAARLGGGERP